MTRNELKDLENIKKAVQTAIENLEVAGPLTDEEKSYIADQIFAGTYEATLYRFKATDSGRFGKAFEINCKRLINGKRGNSDRVAAKGKVDMTNKGVKYEIKSNCGELTAISRNKYIIYTYDNRRDYAEPQNARVIPSADFIAILEDCGLIRQKKTTNCALVTAIQSYKNSKRKSAMLAEMVDRYPTVAEWFD